MHTSKALRVVVLGCVAAMQFGLGTAWAQPNDAKRTQTVIQPLAISDADVRDLMDNFSASRGVITQQSAAQIYQATCQGCHMSQGQGTKGGAGFYPSLASNSRLAAGAYPALVMINGQRGMPSFAARLSDQQIADVANYVRTNFGNSFADAIQAAEVKALRSPSPSK